MNQIIGIYKIVSPTNKVYIGQSRDIHKRMKSYKNLGCKSQVMIYNSLKKYGFDKHSIEILYTADNSISQQALNSYERFFWNEYKTKGFEMLNLKEAFGNNGKLSPETKAKISEKHKGKIVSEATKLKQSKMKQGIVPWNKGLKTSEEVKEKLRISHLGQVSWNKGLKTSELVKQKMRKAKRRNNITPNVNGIN